jgi:hypothetical protein
VHHIVLEDYIAAVEAAETRRDRLTAQIAALLPDWTLPPVVAALRIALSEGELPYGEVLASYFSPSNDIRHRPAHQSMINRRYDDRASCLARESLKRRYAAWPWSMRQH